MSAAHELPNPFVMRDGASVRAPKDWPARRREIMELVIPTEYGRLPPTPGRTEGEELHRHEVARLDNARHAQFRIRTGPGLSVSFTLDLLVPAGEGRRAVMLKGDLCWWGAVSDASALAILRRGYILAQFNRTELAHDDDRIDRTSSLHLAHPDMDFGALAGWAWGFHRCVDFLRTLDFVDHGRIAVTGHSRGGKAALLAGATDERIALTAPNGSGCGGSGSFLRLGPDCEALSRIISVFPYWFSPGLKEYIGREEALGFDQHFLKALVAPRPLLSTEAFGDLWANPTGTWLTQEAAREVYRFLGAEERIGTHFREGGHEQNTEDWSALLDFADLQLYGKPTPRRFDPRPFPDLPPGFTWSAPKGR
jgi:hypothetical protein